MKIFKIIKKDFKILVRSKSSALIVLFGPLLLILLVGLAFNTTSLQGIKLGVYSPSYNELTNGIIKAMEDEQYKVVKTETEQQCIDGVKMGVYHVCVKFPDGLEIKNQAKNTITFVVDQSRVNLVYAVKGTINNKIGEKSKELSLGLTGIIVTQLDKTKTELSSRTGLFSDMRNNVDGVESKLSELQTTINTVNLSYTNESDVYMGELIKQVKSIESDLNETAAWNSDIEDLFDNLKDKLDIVDERLTALSALEGSLNGGFGNIRDSLTVNRQKISEVESSSNQIINDISSIAVTDVESIVSPINTVTEPITVGKSNLNYLFPTLVMMVVMFVSLLLSSTMVIREKTSSAYFRNYISPTHGFIFVFSTFITNFLIVLMQLIVVFGVMLYFDPKMINLLANVSGVLLLIASVFILLGMAIGYVFKSEETSTLGAVSIGSILLFFSNTIFPLETLPTAIREIVKYNIFVVGEELLRKTILFEYGLEQLLVPIGIIAAHIVVFIIAIILIRKWAVARYNIHKHFRSRKIKN